MKDILLFQGKVGYASAPHSFFFGQSCLISDIIEYI